MRRARRLPLEELASCLLAVPDPPAPLDWAAIFGNDRPVELEVGCGKGLFLITAAQANPHINYVGVEILKKYQLCTATRLVKRQLRNVRVIQADARPFLHDCVADASLQAVHVYFPDPWWKQRHRKRRVFTPEFAARCEQVLWPGGRLHLATDVAEYFTVMTELLASRTRLRRLPPPEVKAPAHDLDYLTNFERKFRKQDKPIYRAIWER